MKKKKPFLTDIKELRRRARKHIEEGAVTEGYQGDKAAILKLLNEALAPDEQTHADQIAARIVQLGGAPNFSPEGLAARPHADDLANILSTLDPTKKFA